MGFHLVLIAFTKFHSLQNTHIQKVSFTRKVLYTDPMSRKDIKLDELTQRHNLKQYLNFIGFQSIQKHFLERAIIDIYIFNIRTTIIIIVY